MNPHAFAATAARIGRQLRSDHRTVAMIAVVPADKAEAVAAVLSGEGETVVTLGRMIARADGAAGVSYKGKLAL